MRTELSCDPPLGGQHEIQGGVTLSPSRGLLAVFVVLERAARLAGAAWINRLIAFLDEADDAFLVHQESRPVGEAALFVQYAVVLGNFPLEVAKQREIDALLLGKCPVGRGTVHADPDHLCSRLLEFGDISLIRLQLFRSTPGERQDIKG